MWNNKNIHVHIWNNIRQHKLLHNVFRYNKNKWQDIPKCKSIISIEGKILDEFKFKLIETKLGKLNNNFVLTEFV